MDVDSVDASCEHACAGDLPNVSAYIDFVLEGNCLADQESRFLVGPRARSTYCRCRIGVGVADNDMPPLSLFPSIKDEDTRVDVFSQEVVGDSSGASDPQRVTPEVQAWGRLIANSGVVEVW